MKKIFAICLAVLMIVGTSVTAFAANGGFISSPSANLAPEILEFKPGSADCTARPMVTPYSKRDTLTEAGEGAMVEAYNSIKGTSDVTTLNSDLEKLARKLGIPKNELAVSDLFDLRSTDCDPEQHENDNHGDFSIKLKSDTADKFVGLLRMRNGKWELVEDAKVKGDVLSFSIDMEDDTPFAIVVDAEEAIGNSPSTGDVDFAWIWAVIAGVAAIGFVICWMKTRKQKA